ncbi:MAG: hypothetical protein M1825_003575 [Sarcosagium campestre]|nr:MAG: hypothetical protein M1825_003575 [Sarcosagium campestre]
MDEYFQNFRRSNFTIMQMTGVHFDPFGLDDPHQPKANWSDKDNGGEAWYDTAWCSVLTLGLIVYDIVSGIIWGYMCLRYKYIRETNRRLQRRRTYTNAGFNSTRATTNDNDSSEDDENTPDDSVDDDDDDDDENRAYVNPDPQRLREQYMQRHRDYYNHHHHYQRIESLELGPLRQNRSRANAVIRGSVTHTQTAHFDWQAYAQRPRPVYVDTTAQSAHSAVQNAHAAARNAQARMQVRVETEETERRGQADDSRVAVRQNEEVNHQQQQQQQEEDEPPRGRWPSISDDQQQQQQDLSRYDSPARQGYRGIEREMHNRRRRCPSRFEQYELQRIPQQQQQQQQQRQLQPVMSPESSRSGAERASGFKS